jgi:MFS family permease
LGIYIGGSISALAILILNVWGWRITYLFAGLIGIGFAILGLIFIREPPRAAFEKKAISSPS